MKRHFVSTILGLAALACLAPAAIAAQMQMQELHHPPAAAADNTQNRYEAFRQAQQEQWRKTAPLRQQVRLKKHELAALWLRPNATQEELLGKQRELQDARAALERDHLAFKFRMKRQGFDFDHYGMTGHGMRGGHDMGNDMGHGMMGCGMHQGMMGHGGQGAESGMMDGPMGTGSMEGIGLEPDMMMEESWW